MPETTPAKLATAFADVESRVVCGGASAAPGEILAPHVSFYDCLHAPNNRIAKVVFIKEKILFFNHMR